MGRIEDRLAELGLELPAARHVELPFELVRVSGGHAYLSGHGPTDAQGLLFQGKVGADVTLEQAHEAARATGLAMLTSLKDELGELDRVVRWVKALGLVNCTPGFNETPAVVNGFTNLIVDLWAPEAGRHARSGNRRRRAALRHASRDRGDRRDRSGRVTTNAALLRERMANASAAPDRFFEIIHPDVEWDISDTESPLAGVYHGRDTVRDFYRRWAGAFSDWSFEIEEIVDGGDVVVACVVEKGQGRGSGVEVEMRRANVWTFRDGMVVRFQSFSSRERALEAAGVPRPAG